jgi:hypothetical protein
VTPRLQLVGENRCLRADVFDCCWPSTVEGIETTITEDTPNALGDKKKQKKVLRKIPPQIIKDACESELTFQPD